MAKYLSAVVIVRNPILSIISMFYVIYILKFIQDGSQDSRQALKNIDMTNQ